jgi:hypothetical protein
METGSANAEGPIDSRDLTLIHGRVNMLTLEVKPKPMTMLGTTMFVDLTAAGAKTDKRDTFGHD